MFIVVRAGINNVHFDYFSSQSLAGINFGGVDYRHLDLEGIKNKLREGNPEASTSTISSRAGQINKFINIAGIDDYVVTYNGQGRVYHIGRVTSEALFNPNQEGIPTYRKVERLKDLSRDILPIDIKNSLGAIMTVFEITEEQGNRLLQITDQEKAEEEANNENLTFLKEDIEAKSREFIKDKIIKLRWDQVQELVAGVLRSLGYYTKVSPPGPDGGVDIVVTKDGLGLEDPTIIVEVKHKAETIGREDIQKLTGAMRPFQTEKGIFVSTSGFKNTAREYIKQIQDNIVLIDMDILTSLIIENYDKFDLETKTLLPLSKIYWPE